MFSSRTCCAIVFTILATFAMQTSVLANNRATGVLDGIQPEASSPQEAAKQRRAARKALKQERKALKKLKRAALKKKAEKGERAAQIVLAENYAKEASLLGFSPKAANDALSDAVRWYSQAAKRGLPGAISLDDAGVKIYPIRAHRNPEISLRPELPANTVYAAQSNHQIFK